MICLDSQVVVFCMQPPEDEIGERAAALVARCTEQSIPIMISPIVVAELLSGVPENNAIAYLETLKRRFVSPPFDDLCALHFARIWRTYRSRIPQFQREGLTRQRIKADWLIAASALAHGAQVIYSQDEDVHRCAEGLIEVRYLDSEPIPANQPPLPMSES